jgi:hypothetical protein
MWALFANYIVKDKTSPSKFRKFMHTVDSAKYEANTPYEIQRKEVL